MNIYLKANWVNPITTQDEITSPIVLNIPFGALVTGSSSGDTVTSVNGQTGDVVLDYDDVNAESYSNAQTQYTSINLALATKVNTTDLNTTLQSYATNSSVASADAVVLLSAQTYTDNEISDLTTQVNSQLSLKADLVSGVIPTSQIPSVAITEFLGAVNSEVAMLALTGQKGDFCIRTDQSMTYVIVANTNTGIIADWIALPQASSPVSSVNGQIGVVVLNYSDVGADQAGTAAGIETTLQAQIDTKADAAAIISSLNLKADKSTTISAGTGLNGGGDLSTNRTLSIANTGVVSGTFGSSTQSNTITVNDQGQITSIVENTIPTSFIEWVDVTKVPAALAFGYSDNSYPFQIGKDSDGNVYVRGAMRNTGGSSIAGFAETILIPASHKFRWLTSATHYLIPSCGGYFHNIASSTSISGATYLTARTNGTTNWLGISTTLPAGAILVFPLQCIGFI